MSILAALLVLLAGAWFARRFGAFYLRHPIRTLHAMPFAGGARQMLLSLGGTVGVGNISGVGVALALGGAGAIFWMWVGAFASMSLKYAEIILGMLYRRREGGRYRGGAPYYIKEALGKRAAAFFAALLVLDSIAVGGVIQSSAIAEAAQNGFGLSPLVCGAMLAVVCAAILFFGADLFGLSAAVVPIMSVGYIAATIAVILVNAEKLPSVIALIFTEAFSPVAAGGGAMGFLLSPSLRQGIVKGLFSNEAGCGTAAAAHAEAKETVPARQGLFGIFEVFCDTVLLCTLTALAILTALGGDLAAYGAHGVRVCAAAFCSAFGGAADILLFLFVFLFAFATILSYGYYGRESLRYLCGGARLEGGYTVAYCLSLFVGAVAAPRSVWTISDGMICLMLLVNTAAVLCRSKDVFAAHDAFYAQIGKYSARPSRMRSRASASAKNVSAMSDSDTKRGDTPYLVQNRAK